MKVLHWYPNFLSGGGVANAVLGLAEAQAGLGARVAIAAAEPEGIALYQPMEPSEKVRLICWRPQWVRSLGGFRLRALSSGALRELRSFGADVVHLHGEFNPDNLWAPRVFDVPLVLSPHGAFHPAVLSTRRWLKAPYIALARRALYHRLTAIHALCPAEARHTESLLGNRVAIYCAPQGPNVNVLPAGDAVSDESGGDGVFRFVFVGRLDVHTKGLDILLTAFARAAGAGLDAEMELLLVGPDWGGGVEWLRRRAAELGCKQHVRLTGALPGAKVREALLIGDAYVHLSRHEGFPLSVVEALLLGRPAVLSSEIGTVSYLEVASLPHVRVVPPRPEEAESAMVELVRNRVALRERARECLPLLRCFFSWERVAQVHLERYEEIIRTKDRYSARAEERDV
jgi:glycosyltransferase involved in cell wall biosynthesis